MNDLVLEHHHFGFFCNVKGEKINLTQVILFYSIFNEFPFRGG